MKKDQKFEIDLLRLNNKTHYFDYKIDDDFFRFFEQDIVEKGSLEVKVELIKGEALVEARFTFNGHIGLVCDRSLKAFDYPLNFNKSLFLKYGESEEELDENLIQVSYEHPVLDVGRFIFEFVVIQMPAKKVHPSLIEEQEEETDSEEELFFSTISEEEEEKKETNSGEPTDPRWNELLKLKNKNN